MAILQRIDIEYYLNWLPWVGWSEFGDYQYLHVGINIS